MHSVERCEYVAQKIANVFPRSKKDLLSKEDIFKLAYQEARKDNFGETHFFQFVNGTGRKRLARWMSFCKTNWGGSVGLRSLYLHKRGIEVAWDDEGVWAGTAEEVEESRLRHRRVIDGTVSSFNTQTTNANNAFGLELPELELNTKLLTGPAVEPASNGTEEPALLLRIHGAG